MRVGDLGSIAWLVVEHVRHPTGGSASLKTSPLAQKLFSDKPEPFRIIVLPAAKGIATAWVPRMHGAFLKTVSQRGSLRVVAT